MHDRSTNPTPLINKILNILFKNKGEILDNRLLKLLKREKSNINDSKFDDILIKMESTNLIYVSQRVKGRRVISYNKNNNILNKDIF
jgi:hypothetical protein